MSKYPPALGIQRVLVRLMPGTDEDLTPTWQGEVSVQLADGRLFTANSEGSTRHAAHARLSLALRDASEVLGQAAKELALGS